MSYKYHIIILFLLIISLESCYKDEIIINNSILTEKNHPPISVSGSVVGLVHDEYGNELSDFQSILNDKLYYSNQRGYYHFNAKDINKNGTPITIYKNGQYHQFTLKPIDKEINYFSHTIFTKPLINHAFSNKNLNINLSNNTSISIDANSFQKDNLDFNGEIILNSYIIDLANPIHLEAIPGDHLAIDAENDEVWLDYSHVLHLDIESSDNKEITIKRKSGKISFSLNSDNYEKHKIWKYNPDKFVWEEYSFTKNETDVNFEITKSGYYCYAKPYIYNLVEGQILAGIVPFRNQAIDIYTEHKLLQRVYTTNNGKWFTHLPINKQYRYEFVTLNNETIVNDFLLEEKDVNILPKLQVANLNSINLKGEIRNCDDVAQKNNFFQLWNDEKYKCLFLIDPQVDINIITNAKNTIKLQSADESWINIGPKQSFTNPKLNINFKKSYSCTQFRGDGYFNIKIDNAEKILNPPVAIFENNRTKFTIYDFSDSNLDTNIEIYISGKEARDYLDTELNLFIEHLEINGVEYGLNCKSSTTGCGFESFTIEDFGENKGDWIKGSFKGKFWIKTNNPFTASYKTIEAEFLVQRNF